MAEENDRGSSTSKANKGGRPSVLEQAEDWFTRPPGTAESLIPVWGSAREAVSDFATGHPVLGTINAGLAVSDLFVAGQVAKGVAKGGMKLVGSHTWNATRKWMGRNGMLDFGQHGHHWLIPRNEWGAKIPDVVKNQPWNIKGLDAETHGRIHGRYKGKPQYNPVQGAVIGTPGWAKVVAGSDATRAGMAPLEHARETGDR